MPQRFAVLSSIFLFLGRHSRLTHFLCHSLCVCNCFLSPREESFVSLSICLSVALCVHGLPLVIFNCRKLCYQMTQKIQ